VPPKQVPHIFVVDDEQVIASTLATILQLNGFIVTPFTRPVEALLAARLEAPDILISDVMMPELSGIDLAIELRELYPKCKVLLFSGQAATSDLLERARERGQDFRLLLKPVLPVELLAEIDRLPGGPLAIHAL
jgi:CheY-like chemotaxis protein